MSKIGFRIVCFVFLSYFTISLFLANKSYGFVMGGVVGAILLLILTLHFVILIRFVFLKLFLKKEEVIDKIPFRRVVLTFFLFDCAFLGIAAYSHFLQVKTREIGDSILNKAEEYRTKNGNYPSSLIEMYGSKIPKPLLVNSEYGYSVNKDNSSVSLSYESSNSMVCFIESKVKTWQCDD